MLIPNEHGSVIFVPFLHEKDESFYLIVESNPVDKICSKFEIISIGLQKISFTDVIINFNQDKSISRTFVSKSFGKKPIRCLIGNLKSNKNTFKKILLN